MNKPVKPPQDDVAGPQARHKTTQVMVGNVAVGGASLWAATTLLVKASPLRRAPPEKALGYQVGLSIPILGMASWLAISSSTTP